jgi:hypothetical protein
MPQSAIAATRSPDITDAEPSNAYAHESLRTTKLYDRTTDDITLEEIERIRF